MGGSWCVQFFELFLVPAHGCSACCAVLFLLLLWVALLVKMRLEHAWAQAWMEAYGTLVTNALGMDALAFRASVALALCFQG